MTVELKPEVSEQTQQMAERIRVLFAETLTALLERRDAQYASAVKQLDDEASTLAGEYGELESGIKAIESVLPREERLIQHQVDELLHDGKHQDAANKRAELAALKQKVLGMKQRMSEIQDRFLSINQEKQVATREIFEQWLTEVRPVVRAAERGLLVVLLGGLEKSLYEFQSAVGMTKLDNRTRPLVSQSTIVSLTSGGQSEEFAAGRHWYR